MERLTEKVNEEYIHKVHKYCLNDCYKKLGALEDIESELGIPLEVLFKALKVGIWCMTKEDGIEFMYRPKLFHYEDRYYFREDIFWFEAIVETKDYGKTWWLEKPNEKVSD